MTTKPLIAPSVSLAAWQLEDAINDRFAGQYPKDIRARDLAFKVAEAQIMYKRALVVMIILTLLETPAWCDTNTNLWSFEMAPHKRCFIDGVQNKDILLSNLPYIPPMVGVVVEIVFLAVASFKLKLEWNLQKRFFTPLDAVYFPTWSIAFGAAMIVLEFADCIFFICFRPSMRVAFVARTGLLFLLPSVKKLVNCVMAVIYEFVSIAAFLVSTTVFFAWIVVTIFSNVEGSMFGMSANTGMDTFTNTLNTMFIAGSTDEFLDKFLPSYTVMRQSGLLWLLFLILVQVLLLNLVLDTLVSAYMDYQESHEEEVVGERIKGVQVAFQTLLEVEPNEDRNISKNTFLEFVKAYGSSPMANSMDASSSNIIFRLVADEHRQTLDFGSFCTICSMLECRIFCTRTYSCLKSCCPCLWDTGAFTWFRGKVESGAFGTFMNYVLLVNLFLVITETVYDLNDMAETALMENLELIFSLIYVSEVLLNLSVYSWEQYWSLNSNRFDFVTTWLLLASAILQELTDSGGAGANLKRYMNILRLLRLLRVVKQLKRLTSVQFMVETITTIAVASQEILSLLGAVMFFFTTLSVQLWGGVLYRTNPAIEGSEYAEKKWFVLNFNDVPMAFGAWVVMLLCEYVPAFSDVIASASSMSHSWVVFVIFYVCAVSVVFELVKAFTIEVFLKLRKEWGSEEGDFEKLLEIQEEFKHQGLTLHYYASGTEIEAEKFIEGYEETQKEEG